MVVRDDEGGGVGKYQRLILWNENAAAEPDHALAPLIVVTPLWYEQCYSTLPLLVHNDVRTL
jgi:hypothetical protein